MKPSWNTRTKYDNGEEHNAFVAHVLEKVRDQQLDDKSKTYLSKFSEENNRYDPVTKVDGFALHADAECGSPTSSGETRYSSEWESWKKEINAETQAIRKFDIRSE